MRQLRPNGLHVPSRPEQLRVRAVRRLHLHVHRQHDSVTIYQLLQAAEGCT